MVRQACPELAEGLTTNGSGRAYFHVSWCPLQVGMVDSLEKVENVTGMPRKLFQEGFFTQY